MERLNLLLKRTLQRKQQESAKAAAKMGDHSKWLWLLVLIANDGKEYLLGDSRNVKHTRCPH